ncbi:DUF4810 domain-containing protein [Acetobacteraceae bacterium ESL0709]|nr:DUF4810 domain-containing protein [Acetobacteraceae bacterium ESL0697]MDF7677455.1 DUF4810 domain-containing protein [Acetobacteraceae bacterium ESL0709]
MLFPKYYGLLACGCLLLSACASGEKPLYAWYHYQPELYAYMQGKDPQQQLTVLEADEQKAQAKGLALPPGFHAHLGLLYARLGQTSQAQTEFQQEKTLFPESASYMDFVLKNMGAPAAATPAAPVVAPDNAKSVTEPQAKPVSAPDVKTAS